MFKNFNVRDLIPGGAWRKNFKAACKDHIRPAIVAIALFIIIGAAILVFDGKKTGDGYENAANTFSAAHSVVSSPPSSAIPSTVDRHSGPQH